MNGFEQLYRDINPYVDKRESLGDMYHALIVAMYLYTEGQLTPEAYNAKIESIREFLQSIKAMITDEGRTLTIERPVPAFQVTRSEEGTYKINTNPVDNFPSMVVLPVDVAKQIANFILSSEDKFSPNQNV